MLRAMKWAIAAAGGVLLAGCSTAPTPKIAEAAPLAQKPSNEVPYQWTLGNAPQGHKDMVAEFGRVGLKPGEYLWVTEIPKDGETRVVIDRLTQMAYVYRADKLVGAATVSTARQGYITPLGEWKILEKRPFYRSKKYDNAPMPWMERIDEYGTAFQDRKSTRLNSSHMSISYAVFCLKKKTRERKSKPLKSSHMSISYTC